MKKELENLKIDHDTLVQQKVSHNSRIQNLQREIEDEKDRGLKNNHIIEVISLNSDFISLIEYTKTFRL